MAHAQMLQGVGAFLFGRWDINEAVEVYFTPFFSCVLVLVSKPYFPVLLHFIQFVIKTMFHINLF